MRVILVVLALTAGVYAQGKPAPRSTPPPTDGPPPIILPFPPLMPQPIGGLIPGVPFAAPNPTRPPDLFTVRPDQPFRTRPRLPAFSGGGFFAPYVAISEPASPIPSRPAPPASGMLRFVVTPTSAQLFVDSYYVGTLDDVDAHRVLTLPAGPHRIEIRAPEYEPAAFDVWIPANDTVTYRAALERLRPPAPIQHPTATGSRRMYVIPNCYAGNSPPRADRLPPGCDIRNVRILD